MKKTEVIKDENKAVSKDQDTAVSEEINNPEEQKAEEFRKIMEAKLKAGEHHIWMVKDYNRTHQNQK